MSDSGPVIAAASIQATTKSIQTNINLATLPPGFMSPLLKCGKQPTQRLGTFISAHSDSRSVTEQSHKKSFFDSKRQRLLGIV
jgi:hypothetical protein